ncbi:MAG: hypothetical protein KA712_22630 [Myxococcales bacterium]|nr:hypothetical protein [Myxococcales bacterium]
MPAPLLLSFELSFPWSSTARVAASPLVERIEPAPGTVAALGTPAPAPPSDCPAANEDVASKIAGIDDLKTQGRRPVIVEMKDEGLLPAPLACPEGGGCGSSVARQWERTILNTRHVTCVKRWLDASSNVSTLNVAYVSQRGDVSAPGLPPTGQAAATLKAFGVGLTWDEAVSIAAHPYVKRVWTSPDLQFEPEGKAGCPPDVSKPIPTKSCSSMTEDVEGKISDSARATFAAYAGVAKALVSVKGGAKVCPLPNCPEPCVESTRIKERWTQENLAAQRCVREAIATMGGAASTDTFWLVNAFEAYLTWPQIQLLAAHPDVSRIEPASGGTRPEAP